MEHDFSKLTERVSQQIAVAARQGGHLRAAMNQVIDESERLLQTADEMDGSKIACRAGCKTCCVVNVSTLLPEGLAIVDEIRQWPQPRQSAVRQRLDELWRAVRGLTDEERISLSQSCAFLDEMGACSIYPVRPLLCRSVTSTDPESCRQAITAHFFDTTSPVLMNLFQRGLFSAVYLGVAEGLERAGLEHRSSKLVGLVRYLLKNPDAEAQLLSGKRLDWHELG